MSARRDERDGRCNVCRDDLARMRVLEISGGTAVVADLEGRRSRVALDFVPDARPGDLLLVSRAVALGREGAGRAVR